MSLSPKVGNILGAARAEADTAMLAKAFVETADYQALIQTDDFNFVVGRRGAGKSALFSKVREHLLNESRMSVVPVTPPEHDTMEMQRLLVECGLSYLQLRAVSRLAWKIHLLVAAAKVPSPAERAWIRTMSAEHQRLMLVIPAELLARCIRKLRNPNRRDYTEDVLSKRMDTFVRSYLNMPSAKKFRKKKPKSVRRQTISDGQQQRNAKPVGK